MTLFYFIRLAVRNLWRGGQRAIVALLCITFGITALVAMTMIAKSIEGTIMVDPAQLIGGDLSVVRKSGDAVRPADVAQLDALQQSGVISAYTLMAYNNASIMYRTPGSAEMHFAGLGMGVEPQKYPLAGALTIGEPGGAALADLLRQPGDVVVTRDIALEYHLKIGDPLALSDLRRGVPMAGTVRGIAYDTPNHQGDKLYYTIATAQAMAGGWPGGLPVVNTVIANTAQAQSATDALESSGWSVDWAAARRSGSPANMWVIGLRGAGILGLLVGGVGIANTMQVLLRRRQREIAIWKTLGYRAGDLRLVFTIEAGLLGLAGSLLGAALGALISGQVLNYIRSVSTVLYQWTFSPDPPLMGVLAGTLTTVIFAAWAIAVTSQARPMALLRDAPVSVEAAQGCQSVVLGLLLAVPFGMITALVMESAWVGTAVLVCAALGIAAVGGFFSALLWLAARLLPVRAFPLARMACASLRRRGSALVFAMIALFAGVVSLSIGLVILRVSELRSAGPIADIPGYNLNILASADQESAVCQAVQAQHPQRVSVGYRAALDGVRVVAQGGGAGSGGADSGGADSERVPHTDPVLVGRSDPEDYLLRGAVWGSQPDGVYVFRESGLKAGASVAVTFPGGAVKTFPVVGTYDINYHMDGLVPPTGLLITVEGFTRAARPDTLTYFVQVAPDQLYPVSDALSAALPDATVLNLAAYAGRFMRSYQKLYTLPVALSVLALLAGLLLVANAVSLAMLDRRYEVGILKTMGYTRRQVLALFAAEYGLVGLLATITGVAAMEMVLGVTAIAMQNAAAFLLLTPAALALIAFCGTGLTVLTVIGVSWEPSGAPPALVLNGRG